MTPLIDNSPPLDPHPPYVWPEPRVLAGLRAYKSTVPFEPSLRSARALFAVIRDLDEQSTDWLEELLSGTSFPAKVILALYPACPTGQPQLERLNELQMSLLSNADFHIALFESGTQAPSNLLCWTEGDPQREFVAFGPTPLASLDPDAGVQANLVLSAEGPLMTACRNWFDYTWTRTAQLTQDSIRIPELIPAAGTSDALALWREYTISCQHGESGPHASDLLVTVDIATGSVVVKSPSGQTVSSPTDGMGFAGPLVSIIAEIYSQGALVTIDKSTRLKPFDTPIDPKWFGMTSLRQIGGVSRRVAYRISALEEKTLRDLDRLRNRHGELLPKFTFPLGDGIRWMPHVARGLFDQEMQRAHEEGRQRFEAACGKNPESFVKAQMDRILRDAETMYHDFYPQGNLPERAIIEIVEALTIRLKAAADSSFTPKVSYSEIRFVQYQDTAQTSTFGQAFTLLYAIALFPREMVADRYFLRGLGVKEDDLLKAMNVANDAFVRDINNRGIATRAQDEIALLKHIAETEAEADLKCEAVMSLMIGLPLNHICDMMTVAVKEENKV